MIELRWLDRYWAPPPTAAGMYTEGSTSRGERVLQYRFVMGEALYPDNRGSWDRWSEWRDVPTESQMTVSEPPRADNETQEAK